MQSKAATVNEYIASLPEDRRMAIEAIRAVILKNLDKGYVEIMNYGMIGYVVPHSIFPAGYHCDPKQPLPFAGLASQKGYMSLYLMCIYGHEEQQEWFKSAWEKTGKKLDMGKGCVRFKKLEDVALDVIGQAIARLPLKTYVAHYQGALAAMDQTREDRKAAKATPAAKSKSPAAKSGSSKSASKPKAPAKSAKKAAKK